MTFRPESTTDLSELARPSGAFAMLAVDQREALRQMFAQHQVEPVDDEQLTQFKVAATRTLTPHASAVLVDREFGLDRVLAERAVAPGCGLIVAADHFEPAHGELVGWTGIDPLVDPHEAKRLGAVALKLLVLYRPDAGQRERIETVERFAGQCRDAGLVSIVEAVSRAPVAGGTWDRDEGVLAAAAELGSRGADLYKAEVPLRGQGGAAEIRRRCAQITASVGSPWVVLSSGVSEDVFPDAVELACSEGASGFLAGRAVWASCIGAPDVEHELRERAVARLRRLAAIVDETVGR
ncbi:aldolase [Actinobacteria bacterium YIM 96077]|uniref:Aldolase n=1 Tax=Phytoactinopolyspora halophila TaxID=1981511 RepID=A0A329QE73_9ACTN|nr:aldolase [Phytoactinopolyspora halophila]AYY13599.1 aldolase [Actinobacteria bacterium YIM 96077]RAW10735.1 aldolase [Phytoactinopolyspora halophila]